MLVKDLMSKPVEFVAPETTVQAAANLLGELDVGALPVGSADDLQGVLTDRDILFRVVADGEDVRTTRVRDVMSRSTFTCREEDSVAQALDLMAAYHVRRLPVRDEGGRVTGWITLSDIAGRLLDTPTVETAMTELSTPEA